MYKFWIENENGQTLVFNELGGAFTINEIQGLSPVPATINMSEMALVDGVKFNSAKVDMRTIELAFTIEYDAAQNRILVYDVLHTKALITAYYKSVTRDVFIQGYVESIEIGYFDNKQVCTVTILCPSPFWKATQEIVNEMMQVTRAFHFPFASTETPKELVFGEISEIVNLAVVNGGDVQTGLTFELYAKNTVKNPRIFDYITSKFIGLDFTMQPADLITITTGQGNKTITLLRNGAETNLFNALAPNSMWLQLDPDGNVFTYTLGSGNLVDLEVTIKHYNMFEGV